MNSNIRMTIPTMMVLELFLVNLQKGLSGADISKETKILSGTLYPILQRLERSGWLIAEKEDIDPKIARRPRRTYYTLTGEAQRVAASKLAARGRFNEHAPDWGPAYILS